MELADILPEESVIFCADETTKTDVLKMLAETAAGRRAKRRGHLRSHHNREALGSTGLGNGIAIPHGKPPGLKGVARCCAARPSGRFRRHR